MPDRAAALLRDYNAWAQRCGVAPWDDVQPNAGKKKKG
jgi:hypothetical protein